MMDWYRELADSDPRKAHKHYNWSDDRGLYFAADFAGPDDGRASRPRHNVLHPVTGKSCKKPSTGWRWDETKTKWALEQVPPRIHFGIDETTIPNRKSYLEEISVEPYPSIFYRDGRSATLEVESLIGKGWFQFPKNTDVLAELIELTTGPGDIVFDFFAGSGSTGHAVWKANQAQSMARKFVLVQVPEPTERAEYPTIAEICKARIRKAGKTIKDEVGDSLGPFELDVGFRVLKIDTSNMNEVYYAPDAVSQDLLSEQVQNVREGRTAEDLLFQVLLDWGRRPRPTHRARNHRRQERTFRRQRRPRRLLRDRHHRRLRQTTGRTQAASSRLSRRRLRQRQCKNQRRTNLQVDLTRHRD